MDLIEKINEKLTKAQKIEATLLSEVDSLVSEVNKNLVKLESRLSVENLIEEAETQLLKLRSKIISDLRKHALKALPLDITSAEDRIETWLDLKKRNLLIEKRGHLIRSASSGFVSNDVFTDPIACLAVCLIDSQVLTSFSYRKNCLEDLNSSALHLLAENLKIKSSHGELSETMACLSALTRYELKPVISRVCKVVKSTEPKEDTIYNRVMKALRSSPYQTDYEVNKKTGRLEKTDVIKRMSFPFFKHKVDHIKALKKEKLTDRQLRDLLLEEQKLQKEIDKSGIKV